MRRHLWSNRLSAITAVVAGAVTALALGGAMPAVSVAASSAAAGVAPHAIGELDCNGLSTTQRTVKQGLPCIDPRGPGVSRFEERDHYIGHDEPSVRFISSQPGSGNNITFNERLPVEPAKLPTVRHPGKDVTHHIRAEPWHRGSPPRCETRIPRRCCPARPSRTPTRRPAVTRARARRSWSCSSTRPGSHHSPTPSAATTSHWCSALNIDSLECPGQRFGRCNAQCTEPVNFAFVQTNGVPPGRPPRS